MRESGVDVAPMAAIARGRRPLRTIMFVASDAALRGIIALADTRARSERGHRQASRDGKQVVMLTGDNEATALAIRRSGAERRDRRVVPAYYRAARATK